MQRIKNVYYVTNILDHSNWSMFTEIKKNHQVNIDNIINQQESDNLDIPTTSSDSSAFSQFMDRGEREEPKKPEKKKVDTSKWKDEDDDEEDEEVKKMLASRAESGTPQYSIKSLTIAENDHVYSQYENSTIPGIQLALGNIKLVLNYLKSQLGITSNYETLKPIMKDLYMSSYSQIKFMPFVTPNDLLLRRNAADGLIPQNGVNLKFLQDMLNVI